MLRSLDIYCMINLISPEIMFNTGMTFVKIEHRKSIFIAYHSLHESSSSAQVSGRAALTQLTHCTGNINTLACLGFCFLCV